MAAVAVAYIGTDRWNADVYGALSFASRLAEAVKQQRLAYQIRYFLWRVNGRIEFMLDDIHAKLEEAIAEAEKGNAPSEPSDPSRIHTAVASIQQLHAILDGIYQVAIRHRLTNNSVLAASIHRLHHNDERIVELAEWIQDLTNPAPLENIFEAARGEYERGETVVLAE
jgi:hypothetical protein